MDIVLAHSAAQHMRHTALGTNGIKSKEQGVKYGEAPVIITEDRI